MVPFHQPASVSPRETLDGAPGIVDLWSFHYPASDDDAAAWDALLTPEERARRDRFYFAPDRRLFGATRALVRTVLSQYADVPPADWRFATGERGKPYIVAPEIAPRLHFNLTNTHGLVACAVSVAHSAVGVDAEVLDRPGETVALADRYFSSYEVRALRALPPEQQRARFFAYWTLKESYIKARGLGLALPLDQFSFLLDGEAEIGIAFDARLRDDPRRWRFALLDAGPAHLAAVGVDTGGAPLSLRGVELVP